MLISIKLQNNCAKAIAKGLRKDKSILVLNLSGNSIYNYGAELILNSLGVNTTIEKIILANNCLGERIMNEINERTRINVLNKRKKRIPKYMKVINSIVVSDDIYGKLEKEFDDIKTQKDEAEIELKLIKQQFADEKKRQIKLNDITKRKYELMNKAYNQVVEELEISEIDEKKFENQFNKEYKALTHQIMSVNREIRNLEVEINDKKNSITECINKNEETIKKLNNELDKIFKDRAEKRRMARLKYKEEQKEAAMLREEKMNEIIRNTKPREDKSKEKKYKEGKIKEEKVQEEKNKEEKSQEKNFKEDNIQNIKPNKENLKEEFNKKDLKDEKPHENNESIIEKNTEEKIDNDEFQKENNEQLQEGENKNEISLKENANIEEVKKEDTKSIEQQLKEVKEKKLKKSNTESKVESKSSIVTKFKKRNAKKANKSKK